MINVIIEEDLYDHEFVEEWCYGFDQLKERAAEYPVEKVAEITWIPADKIRQAARMYATTKPACLPWGEKGGDGCGLNAYERHPGPRPSSAPSRATSTRSAATSSPCRATAATPRT